MGPFQYYKKKQQKQQPSPAKNMHGTSSLIGGSDNGSGDNHNNHNNVSSGISLDGESLILPSMTNNGNLRVMDDDEISSINSSIYHGHHPYNHHQQPRNNNNCATGTTMATGIMPQLHSTTIMSSASKTDATTSGSNKQEDDSLLLMTMAPAPTPATENSGTKTPTDNSNDDDERPFVIDIPMTAAAATRSSKPSSKDKDTTTGISSSGNDHNVKFQKQQQQQQPDDDKKAFCCCCCPLWLSRSPLWLKIVLCFSLLLLLAAVAMVALGLTVGLDTIILAMGSDNNNSNDSSAASSSSNSNNQVGGSSSSSDNIANRDPNIMASTLVPTSSPPTASPSSGATEDDVLLTLFPTLLPVENLPATTTTGAPTVAATTTALPTLSPSKFVSPERSVFYVVGGSISSSSSATTAQQQLTAELPLLPTYGGRAQMIHLGDWNSDPTTTTSSGSCDASKFEAVHETFSHSSVPVYFVMGDNEFSECADNEKAQELWQDHLAGYEREFWDAPDWTVWRDAENDFPENFSFGDTESGVAVIGISQFGQAPAAANDSNSTTTPTDTGSTVDTDEWIDRQENNLAWISENYFYFRNRGAKMMLIMTNTAPSEAGSQAFYRTLTEQIRDTYRDLDFLIVHTGPEDTTVADVRRSYDGIPNLSVVSVVGGAWPPTRIQVSPRASNDEERLVVDQTDAWWNEWVEDQNQNV